MSTTSDSDSASRSAAQRIGLIAGVVVFTVVAVMPLLRSFVVVAADKLGLPPAHPDVLEAARGTQMTLAIALLMVIWWITEAVPVAVTALVPAALLTLLHVTGAADGRLHPITATEAFANFSNRLIFLFLAGFILAGGIRKSKLDRRLTLWALSLPGVSRGPAAILLAVMVMTAILSMMISNTATAAMMLPMALAILHVAGETPGRSKFGTALMLGVGWSASLGGIGTLIGSPPNLIVAGVLESRGITTMEFLDWLEWGLPVSLVGVVIAWLLLLILFRPPPVDAARLKSELANQRREIGRISRDEIVVSAVVLLVLILWMSHPAWPRLLPAGWFQKLERIGIHELGLACALLLFILPIERKTWRSVLSWPDAVRYVDWGTLLLFGGALTLSAAMFQTSLTDWAAGGIVARLHGASPLICLIAVVLLVDFLTEITSNTAVTAMIAPILVGAAGPLGIDPEVLCVAAAMAASMAFMLPVATPPNAIVYSSGYFTVPQMMRAGFLMNLVGCALVVVVVSLLAA